MAFYICPQCGADIDLEEGNTCEFCGHELEMINCISCGKEIPKDSNVCIYCGADQDQEKKVKFDKTETKDESKDVGIDQIEEAIENEILQGEEKQTSHGVEDIEKDFSEEPVTDQKGSDIEPRGVEVEEDTEIDEESITPDIEGQFEEEQEEITPDIESQIEQQQQMGMKDEIETEERKEVIEEDIQQEMEEAEEFEEYSEVEDEFEDLDQEYNEEIQEQPQMESEKSHEEIIEENIDEKQQKETEPEQEEIEEDVISNVSGIEEEIEEEEDTLNFGHTEEIEEIEELEDSEPTQQEFTDEIIEQESTEDEIEEIEMDETVREKKESEIEEISESVDQKEEADEHICPECGASNPAQAKFCLSCGSKLEKEEKKKKICPECGTENLENAKFCMVCGTVLKETEKKSKQETEEKREQKTPQEEEKIDLDKIGVEDEEIEEKEEKSEQVDETKAADKEESVGKEEKKNLVKTKITYDNDNKFKFRFVFNKIKEVKPDVDEEELKMLMSNKTFVIEVSEKRYDEFKEELEELDCEVEDIGFKKKKTEEVEEEKIEKEEKEEEIEEKKETKKEINYFLKIIVDKDKNEKWQTKFANMLSAMRTEIDKDKAEKYASGDLNLIDIEDPEEGEQLAKVISALGCKTEIVDADGKPVEKVEKKKEKKEKKEKKKKIKKEKKDQKEKEKPKFLILSGVAKKNWVVREKLLEKLVDMYPNMTHDIVEGIVSQPVVKLRLKNIKEAKKYKPTFEEMGWNVRIEDVEKMMKAKKKKSKKKIDVNKRKKTHRDFLKREKGKRRNILTTIIVLIFAMAVGYLVYINFFAEYSYVLVQADVGHEEVELSTSGNPVIKLRKEPEVDSRAVGIPVPINKVLELSEKKPVSKDGYQWYKVEVPGMREVGYIRADIVVRSDKSGNPVTSP